jgi:hypothetical protein
MFHFYNEADKANQQYNETQEIEADAKKVKKDSTKKTMVKPDALNVDVY